MLRLYIYCIKIKQNFFSYIVAHYFTIFIYVSGSAPNAPSSQWPPPAPPSYRKYNNALPSTIRFEDSPSESGDQERAEGRREREEGSGGRRSGGGERDQTRRDDMDVSSSGGPSERRQMSESGGGECSNSQHYFDNTHLHFPSSD